MRKPSNYIVRVVMYLVGLAIMTLGVAISIKSNLGVSPVSSIPYSINLIWGLEMGLATIVFHVVLVCVQIVLLRKKFAPKNLLQVPVGVLFGGLTTWALGVAANFPSPDGIVQQVLFCLISTVIVAFGIFLYVPADLIPLAGEGTMLAISQLTGVKFSTVKIAFDITMVVVSLVSCLALLHSIGSVGVGTIVAAVLVGVWLKFITRALGSFRDRLLAIGC